MMISIIVAVSENGVIGIQDDLPWRLSSDLKRFKSLTMGHHIIMGRKTWQSIGRLLPGRTTVILTRQENLMVPGALIAGSLHEGIDMINDDSECFIVGGAEIYREAFAHADRIYLTRVEAQVTGDTFLPAMNGEQWELKEESHFPSDEKNEYPTRFQIYDRIVEENR